MALSDAERNVDGFRDREPVDSLKDEREAQVLFQLDYHGAFVPPYRHDVAWPDLSLHRVALSLQELLDRVVKVDLSQWVPSRRALLSLASPHGAARAIDS